jgi:hypothetical protein
LVKIKFSITLIFFLFLTQKNVWALAPVESLVLGDFSENYTESETDPLNYVFSKGKIDSNQSEFKKELAYYRGFYDEGKNILNYCKTTRPIRYSSEWEKLQVKRSLMSEIQYIGLDIASRALPQYAKALDFTKEEFTNLVDGLVGNFCSANLSVISKKELRNNLLIKFNKDNNFKIPNNVGNSFFPDNLENYTSPKLALEQEFKYTIKLFQSICSWSGNPTNPGLMVPILKHPSLMAFFFRQMNNQSIEWREFDNKLFIKEDLNTVQVVCDNLLCRKSSREIFFQKIYFSIGGTSLSEDLRRLYCEDFQLSDYKTNEQDERLKKIINSRTFDEEYFINSQFIALLTGVPDFLIKVDKFSKGEDLLRAGVDYTWTKWAKSQTEFLNRELYFEEPLLLELVDRKLSFDPNMPKLKISFDINLGEFDRINQKVGKVKVSFNIMIQRNLIHYLRQAFKDLDPRNTAEKERLIKRLKFQITKDIILARQKFIIPPWKGDLEGLIATELSEELMQISDKNFVMPSTGQELVTVDLNYGLFALKYINHQKIVQNAQNKK